LRELTTTEWINSRAIDQQSSFTVEEHAPPAKPLGAFQKKHILAPHEQRIETNLPPDLDVIIAIQIASLLKNVAALTHGRPASMGLEHGKYFDRVASDQHGSVGLRRQSVLSALCEHPNVGDGINLFHETIESPRRVTGTAPRGDGLANRLDVVASDIRTKAQMD